MHPDACTHKPNSHEHSLLHTKPLHTLLRTDAFTHTQMLLRTDAFRHRHFYTQRHLHADNLHTQKLLDREAFAYRGVSTNASTHRVFYTPTLLHTQRPTLHQQMSYIAWEPTCGPSPPKYNHTCSSVLFYQNVVVCCGTCSVAAQLQSFFSL